MQPLDLGRFVPLGLGANGAVTSSGEQSVLLTTPPDGGYLLLAGDALAAFSGSRRDDEWIVVDALNEGDQLQGVMFGFFRRESLESVAGLVAGRNDDHQANRAGGSGSASGVPRANAVPRPDLVAYLGIFPGLPTRLSLPLRALNAEKLFIERTPGRLKTLILGEPLEPDELAGIAVGVKPTHRTQTTRLRDLRLERSEPEYPLPTVHLVDELGQWESRVWPGRTSSAADLVAGLNADWEACREDNPTAGHPGARSARGDSEASGFFRVDRRDGRHIMIDPSGNQFYSLGVDCVSPAIAARTDGIERLYAWLPPRHGEYAECWREHEGYAYFDFLRANLVRAFGDQWRERWTGITAARLRRWGFNTVGNWSSERFARGAGLPYVWPLEGFPSTEATVFRDFPDVYSTEYERAARGFARQLEAFVGDPNMIGYFLRNEPHWAFVDDINLAEFLLSIPERLATRDALIGFLSERYGGDVRALCDAWEWPSDDRSRYPRPPASWAELGRPVDKATSMSAVSRRDLQDFTRQMIERYVRVPSEACRTVDPNHLNLGLRWAWISQEALYAGSEHCDVFSINCYKPNPSADIDEAGTCTGLPVMVGEFHFGALDRGLPATGLKGVATQRERGLAYRHYVENAAANRFSIGVHYFTLYDQAVLGRFDGENFQIGLLDTCNRPHDEFVRVASDVNRRIDEVMAGTRSPLPTSPRETTVGF